MIPRNTSESQGGLNSHGATGKCDMRAALHRKRDSEYSRVAAAGLLLSCWLFAPAEASPLFQAGFLSYDVGTYPYSVAIGDLNGDGLSDLAVTNGGSNTVSVLLGNGNGTFGTKTDFVTG